METDPAGTYADKLVTTALHCIHTYICLAGQGPLNLPLYGFLDPLFIVFIHLLFLGSCLLGTCVIINITVCQGTDIETHASTCTPYTQYSTLVLLRHISHLSA